VIDSDLARKLGDAGVDLGVMGIQWGRRPDRSPACSVTDRDLRLLRLVHDFGYVSTSTLAAMFWGRYGSAVRERLKLLHDIGLLDKLRPRVGRTMGAPEWVYRLTMLGWRALRDQGEPADAEAFRPAKLTSIAYVEHDVQVAALMAQIAARAAEFVGRTGPLIDAAPFELLGPRSGAIDPRRERLAPDASPASDLAGRRVRLGRAHPGVLKPDATMIGVDRNGNRTAVMFEFDRTRRPSKQIERLQRYDWFLTVGWRESRYACLDLEPAVLMVCDDVSGLPALARVANRSLTASIHVPTDRDSEFPGREQVAFVARDVLLRGCDELHQLVAAHGQARELLHTQEFSLHRLFVGR
jgi:Replication-relaxation